MSSYIFSTEDSSSGGGGSSAYGKSEEIRSPSHFTSLTPLKREINDLTDLTINKLAFKSLGFYGREKEVSALIGRLNSLVGADASSIGDTAQRGLVLLSGTSGIGKTRLAETLRAPTLKHGGLFVRGKFDLNMRNEPYSGIAEAFAEILGAILPLQGENPERFQSIRGEIEATLGSELYLLFEVIPVLSELVDGMEASSDHSSPTGKSSLAASSEDSKNRINFAFLRFVRIVAKHFDPLVIVLDDLQWADASSLDLLEVMMNDRQNPKLMVIGLYRSNEVDETHIFHRYMNFFETKSREEGDFYYMDQLEIGDLDIKAVHHIIQDLLCTDDSRTLGLAEVCMRKTHGNPFFLIHFLSMLYDKELLQFNFGTLSWRWDEEEIDSSTSASENVVDLLTNKMNTFDANLLDMLKLASCLGSTFEVHTLQVVWVEFSSSNLVENITDDQISRKKTEVAPEGEESAFHEALLKLYTEGLLVRVSGSPPRIGWVHDKVQEAAMGLILESDRETFSRQVGETLVSKLDPQQLDSALFVVVNLLNGSSSSEAAVAFSTTSNNDLDDESGSTNKARIQLARMNFEACEKAVKISAFETAAKCARAGIDLLPANAWTTHYKLALKLYSIGAKAEGFLGNLETMERYCRAVLAQEDRPIEDKFDVYNTWIDSLSNTSYSHAADLIFEILGHFRCRFPKNKALVGLRVVGNIICIKATMRSRDPSKLDTMTDHKRVELMQFLDKLATCLYMMKDDRMPLAMFRSLNWTVKYGKCDFSPPAFATAGMILTGILNDIQGGSLYGEHAMALLNDNAGTIATSSRTMLIVHSFLFSWTRPLREMFKPLLQGYDIGLQTGDTESATWCIAHWIQFNFYVGTSLERWEIDTFSYVKQMGDLKREQSATFTRLFLQMVWNLLGRDNLEQPTHLAKEDIGRMSEDPFYHSPAMMTYDAHWENCQAILHTYFGEHIQQADNMIALGHDYMAKMHVASPSVVINACLTGVSCFAAARQTGKRKYVKMAHICRSKIKKWLDMGNPNVKHYGSILDAEAMALMGKTFEAIKNYEVAILLAARSGYQQDAALASERLGEFQISVMKNTEEGGYRLREAVKYWAGWGAMAKVADLEKKYPVFLRPQQPSAIFTFSSGGLKATRTTSLLETS